jgi:hypothetical protein
MAQKHSTKAGEEVKKAVREQKKGKLKSGKSGKKVTSRMRTGMLIRKPVADVFDAFSVMSVLQSLVSQATETNS